MVIFVTCDARPLLGDIQEAGQVLPLALPYYSFSSLQRAVIISHTRGSIKVGQSV